MPFTVTITETRPDAEPIERLKQTVEHIDIPLVFRAVNTPPPKPRAVRKDKGTIRPKNPDQAVLI